MIDNYPTRKEPEGRFITRAEPVSYSGYEHYASNGYEIIRGFFDKEIIAECLKHEASGLVTSEPGIKAVRSRTGVHHTEPFKSIYRDSVLLSTIKGILGGPVYLHQSRINYKSSIGANGWHWHSDFETWHSQDGMPGMRCLTAMIPLTENTNCNGSLMVIPQSHELFYSCKKEKTVSAEENFADQKEGVPDLPAIQEFFNHSGGRVEMVTCQPGDLVLFDCNIIHGSTQNMTPLPRTNLFFVYNSIENQLQEPFSTNQHRPEEMGTTKIAEIL